MKKSIFATLCILIIILMAFCLSSCKNRTDEMADLETYTTKQMTKTKKQVIKYINEQDKEGLKKLFSKDAQKHIEDLDGKLDQLIGAFNGNKIKSAKGRSPAFEGSAQTQPLHIYGEYHLSLNSEEKYRIYISLCDKNDKDPDKEGVFKIELRTFTRKESPKDFSGGTYKDEYGIFIYTLQNYPKK
ncbi:DUF5104 domain-containing protein [Mogibacterium diversum]|uniref:DUF5104 domain-containing protein n=1 Tax=Mogibacterium diversum TaxID=114527 RepID=UPI0028D2461D|nr:DUF5104 domain-containing protein [Mogibacterium diversum]